MSKSIDLATFKPNNADDLFRGILTQVAAVSIANFKEFKTEISTHLKSVAQKAWLTKVGLATGEISQADADVALHTQELALSNILLYSKFLTYVLAQSVLEAVFEVIAAAIKNLTGIALRF